MNKPVFLLLILLLTTSMAGQSADKSRQARDVAFVNVSVIPMDRERLLRNQTVIVSDNSITTIGDAKRIKVPAGAQTVDGTGKFLIPGLTDMHVHLFSDDDFPDELAG